jgi:NitT/TauT family transport system permease protein
VSRERLFAFISPLSLLLVWELMSRTGVLDQRIFSRPTSVVVLMWIMLTNGQLARDTGATLARLFVGTLVGTIPGLVLGLTIGLFRTPRAVVNPLISVTYGLPRVALFPLVLLTVGLNEASNVIMVALGPFFTMLIGSAAAVQNVDPIYLKVARSFNVGMLDLYLKVVCRRHCQLCSAHFAFHWGLDYWAWSPSNFS